MNQRLRSSAIVTAGVHIIASGRAVGITNVDASEDVLLKQQLKQHNIESTGTGGVQRWHCRSCLITITGKQNLMVSP